MKSKLQEHRYQNRVLAVSYGIGESAYVEAVVDEFEIENIIRELSLAAKINPKKYAPAVALVAELYRLDPKDYIQTNDVAISVLNRGYKNREELQRADPELWGVVQNMHLEKTLERRVFSAYQ